MRRPATVLALAAAMLAAAPAAWVVAADQPPELLGGPNARNDPTPIDTPTPTPTPTPTATPTPTPTPAPTSPIPVVPTPVPVFHSTVVARPGLADVRVRLPGTARYVRLTADRSLPLGSVLDTRRGTVELVSVPRRGGKPQRASFDGGVFRVTQPRRTTVLTLVGPCRPARRLSADGHGAFQVRGRYSSSTTYGKRWMVQDSCSRTVTRALVGVVEVRDLARRRTVLVRAGKRYLARPKG